MYGPPGPDTLLLWLHSGELQELDYRQCHPTWVNRKRRKRPTVTCAGRPDRQLARDAFGAANDRFNERQAMTEPIDQLGPVDYLVVEFPGSNFNGEIMPELVDLVQRGIVKVLDLVLIKKEEDGSFDAFEFDDIEDGLLGDLREIERELADVLSAEDVASVAEALEPGSTAGLLVYENLWAAPFASAVRRSGGQLIANGRIPVQALLAAIESDDDESADEAEGA
jgi:hypothetical protein